MASVQPGDRMILKRGIGEIVARDGTFREDAAEAERRGDDSKSWLRDFEGWDLQVGATSTGGYHLQDRSRQTAWFGPQRRRLHPFQTAELPRRVAHDPPCPAPTSVLISVLFLD